MHQNYIKNKNTSRVKDFSPKQIEYSEFCDGNTSIMGSSIWKD